MQEQRLYLIATGVAILVLSLVLGVATAAYGARPIPPGGKHPAHLAVVALKQGNTTYSSTPVIKEQHVVTKSPPPVEAYEPTGIAACIAHYESTGNPKAINPNGHYGLYQFSDATWYAVTGLPGHASDYASAVQTRAFYKLWAGGAGAGNWTTAGLCS